MPAAYLSTIEILAGILVSCIPSYPVLFSRAAHVSGHSGSSGKAELRGSDNFPGRHPAVSWNRITNTDDLDLDDMASQSQTIHGWQTMQRNNSGGSAHGRDIDQRGGVAEKKELGEAITTPDLLASK